MANAQTSLARKDRNWIQLLGGVLVLFIFPLVIVITFFGPDIRNWLQEMFAEFHSQPTATVQQAASKAPSLEEKKKALFGSVAPLVQVSEEEDWTTSPKSNLGASSELSDALSRLHHALRTHPKMQPKKVLEATNRAHPESTPCPFEWISGQASVVLTKAADRKILLVDQLNRCSEAIEQTSILEH